MGERGVKIVIGLIFIGDLKYCPYLSNYTKILEENNIDYEVLYWERSTTDKDIPDHYIPFKYESKLNQSLFSKAKDFLRFRFWLKKRLTSKKYDKLILLSTLSGMIIPDVLKRYTGKYIFDVRDYSYESNSIFKNIESKIIENSYFTAISSDAFRNFLPQSEKYILNHNINLAVNQNRNYTTKMRNTINLVFAGTLRYFEHQKKIIDKLANDNRFNIIFHGTGPEYEQYKEYVETGRIKNMILTGEYSEEAKENLYQEADLLNNSYDNQEGNLETKYAVSNKFYDGIIYKIPQLVETNSYKEELINKYNIGIALDVNEEKFADLLFDYYQSINVDNFNAETNALYQSIMGEQKKYYKKITDFINN